MDEAKRIALIHKLSQLPEDALISLDEFFDGNDDMGSIGCNLMEHPGLDVFRDTLRIIASRQDVVDVLVGITEVDPGFGAWPFSDAIFVVGRIGRAELEDVLAILEPDEVERANEPLPPALRVHAEPAFRVWWD